MNIGITFVVMVALASQSAHSFWQFEGNTNLSEVPSCLGSAQHAKVKFHGGREYTVAYEHDTDFTYDCCWTVAKLENDGTRTVILKLCLQKREGNWFIFEAKDAWMNQKPVMHGPFRSKQEVYDVSAKTVKLLFDLAP